jgi:hypothetical protein
MTKVMGYSEAFRPYGTATEITATGIKLAQQCLPVSGLFAVRPVGETRP